MPRIDPLQLLKCLAVLLSPEGGILSRQEVPRLVNLMTKFSKKLVSKCVYILILKNTERSLVNLFMAEGGWNLIYIWLQDAVQISNWDLVQEILSLLLVTPVDVERLKLNNIPKLVKSLSRLEDVKGVQELSTQLVHDWLIIVKGSTVKAEEQTKIHTNDSLIKTDLQNDDNNKLNSTNDTVDSSQIKAEENDENNDDDEIATTFYKVTVRDGKQIISKTDDPTALTDPVPIPADPSPPKDESKSDAGVKKDKSSDNKLKSSSSSDKNKSKSRSSSSSSSKHSSSSSRSKSSGGSSSRHKSSSSSKSSSSRDKDRKDKHRSNGSSKSSSSSSSGSSSSKDKSESKDKQAEKDKDTLAKLKPQSIDKIGRIPKKTDDKKEHKEVKKPTMSIEVRKNNEERPKTVKVFNSKRRSTGLEEEAKPPPPRPVKKPSSTAPVVIPPLPQKRPSPPRDASLVPPEKKLKVDIPERPGAIKLIPPKPKPSVLQESDIFMDALTASASKKETKRRKRRPSVTKETPGSPQDPQTPTSPLTSPLGLKNIAAPNFYQDTLETTSDEPMLEEKKDEQQQEERSENSMEGRTTPIEENNEEVERTRTSDDGLKGVLVYAKRKGPKKSVKFNDSNLTQVRFFELDETERVNVTKTFMDMAKMEMSSEREALQMSRKLPNEDTMEPQTMWRMLYLIDQNDPLAVPGGKSLEKDIQFAREKSVLQALYFDKRKIPDSPEEPIPENHQMIDPITIPLEDADSQEVDLTNTAWPEPKGSPPRPFQDNALPPQIFQNIPMPFQNFNQRGPSFQGLPPRFGPAAGPFGPIPNGMGPNMVPDLLPAPGPLNPNAFGPGPPMDNFNMMNENNFPIPPFANNQNVGGFQPNNFNMNRAGGGRGGPMFRGRGGGNNGPWIRMNGPHGGGSWSNNRGGSGGGGRGGGRICKNIKNHGFCRHMDKCPFVHPK